MVKRLPLKEFKYIYSKVPRLCVDLIIKTPDGVLLSKRDIPPAKGWWHIPGGSILMGESIEQAIKRVAKRELNLEVKVEKLLGIIEYSQKYAVGQSIALAYQISIISGNMKGNEEAREIKFFKKIPQKTIPEQKIFFKNLLKFPCED